MYFKKISTNFILTLLLTSCAGLPPITVLDGKVVDDTYYSVDGAFKVKLPNSPTASKEEKYEWTYTKVTEFKDKELIGVDFGPAAFDQNIYQAALIRYPLKTPKRKFVNYVLSQKVKARKGDFSKKISSTFILNGKKCYYAVYESDYSFLVLSIVDNVDSFYSIDAHMLKQRNYDNTNDDDLSRTEWPVFNKMLESFVVLNSKYEI